eukprot:TRINITY_DN20581_c0_g1_i1.p1 TRINITY_DN20581_c0_g1~~TRINITY_DN20581_c0_g1_i1.p1  ORF type:complete len:407 (+),score=133.37 TRINITY_DN20581_c0_g1_i1:54-1274(+)
MEGFVGNQILVQPEAEAMVRDLEPFSIEDVGTKQWQLQRKKMEQLNCQAHYNTSKGSGDFVTDAVLGHDKVTVVIHELLVIEQWRRKVFPSIREKVMAMNPTCLYSLLYYEGVLVNFLELVFWTEEGVARCDDDLLEVLDYLWRNIITLNSANDDYWPSPSSIEDIKSGAGISKMDSERRQEFTICMTSISLLWYIIDKMKVLPMSAVNNILKKNDMPVGLAVLLDNRPWLRRGTDGMEKFITKEWKKVTRGDTMVVCEYEAHVWFMMHCLLTNPICREKYSYTVWRKDQLLKCRKFLNEILLDQIPPLADLQRALDELSFLDPPASAEEKFKSTLVIEPVPRLMNSILKGANFKSLSAMHEARLTDKATVMEQSKEMSQMIDQLIGSLEGGDIDEAQLASMMKNM